jgi:hypothetical protein
MWPAGSAFVGLEALICHKWQLGSEGYTQHQVITYPSKSGWMDIISFMKKTWRLHQNFKIKHKLWLTNTNNSVKRKHFTKYLLTYWNNLQPSVIIRIITRKMNSIRIINLIELTFSDFRTEGFVMIPEEWHPRSFTHCLEF